MDKNSKGIVHFLLLFVITLIAFVGIGYYAYKNGQIKLTSKQDVSSLNYVTLSPTPSKTASPTLSEPSYCNCSWAISSGTNVEFLLTSPSGQQTGYLQASNSYINNIPDASYGIGDGIADDTGQSPPIPDILVFQANNPENGVYKLQVIGKETGNYELTIAITFGPMSGVTKTVKGSLKTNQVDNYTIETPEGRIQKVNN